MPEPLEIEIDTDPPSNIEDAYESHRHQSKLRHWKESEYAAGLVEPTWADELESHRRRGARCCCAGPGGGFDAGQVLREEIDPGCGCIYLSALVCSRIGAGRIGNMAVLREREVWVEADGDDGDDENDEGADGDDGFAEEEALHRRNKSGGGPASDGAPKRKPVPRREIQLVVGPFWPMLLFVTYPLILAVSFCTLPAVLHKPLPLQLAWGALTLQLIRSLFDTGFRNPGILKRRKHPPAEQDLNDAGSDNDSDSPPPSLRRRMAFRRDESGPWRWSDQAQTYRPRNAAYDPDCKVVIEEFDHTCPWTGTAIGKKNMGSFQCFVGLVFICLIMDIFLLTGTV